MRIDPIIPHPRLPDFWRHDPPKYGICAACGDKTMWIELDMSYMHPSCDLFPSEEGDVRVIRGKVEVIVLVEGRKNEHQ